MGRKVRAGIEMIVGFAAAVGGAALASIVTRCLHLHAIDRSLMSFFTVPLGSALGIGLAAYCLGSRTKWLRRGVLAMLFAFVITPIFLFVVLVLNQMTGRDFLPLIFLVTVLLAWCGWHLPDRNSDKSPI